MKIMRKRHYKDVQNAQQLALETLSEELVTPLRLFIVLMISASLITIISLSVSTNDADEESKTDKYANLSVRPFVYNFNEAMKTREENVELYDHPFQMWTVEKRSKLSLQEFWDIYDSKWPVVIQGVVDKWPAINWTKDFFVQNYGEENVMVKMLSTDGINSAISMMLKDFILQFTLSTPDTWLYLEDELFLVKRPQLRKDIGMNIYAEDNFFDLFQEEIKPWDCLLLWGKKHSRSSLHIDPYNWTATSSVLLGRKSWKLFPPGQDHLLYIHKKRKCNFPLQCIKYDSPINAFDPDIKKYPNFEKANYLEVDVLPGEMLIIPNGWYHQAYNKEETLAISGQLMNRNNYLVVLEEIIKGGNIKRNKLPAHFHTLLPPDQVKLFLSQLEKKVLRLGKTRTEDVLKNINK